MLTSRFRAIFSDITNGECWESRGHLWEGKTCRLSDDIHCVSKLNASERTTQTRELLTCDKNSIEVRCLQETKRINLNQAESRHTQLLVCQAPAFTFTFQLDTVTQRRMLCEGYVGRSAILIPNSTSYL